jgi:hypothetical protein
MKPLYLRLSIKQGQLRYLISREESIVPKDVTPTQQETE